MLFNMKAYERFATDLIALSADFQMTEFHRCRDVMRQLMADYEHYTGKSAEELYWWHTQEKHLKDVPLTHWAEIAREAVTELLQAKGEL